VSTVFGDKLAKAADYPYTSGTTKVTGQCNSSPIVPLNNTHYYSFDLNGNSTALKQLVTNYGPATVAMYVSDSGLFNAYNSGIFYDPSCPVGPNQCNSVNHGKFNLHGI
jgi:hypothetical protein